MILVDGVNAAGVPADDRGLAYGDGLFETVFVRDGRAPLLERHLARLRAGAARLGIAAPDDAAWRADVARVTPTAEFAVVKLMLTRGSGGRGYGADPARAPRRIAVAAAWPERPAAWWTEGIVARLCATRVDATPALAGLKHLNRLPQVLARAEWDDPEVTEGLMLDAAGQLVGGTMTNLFAVLDGELCTPPVARVGVAGIARGLVVERLRARERVVDLAALARAEALFVTNALIGAWPIRRLDARDYPVAEAGRTAQAMLRAEGLPC
jgi:4-amino-4-deoxychorismate lyase